MRDRSSSEAVPLRSERTSLIPLPIYALGSIVDATAAHPTEIVAREFRGHRGLDECLTDCATDRRPLPAIRFQFLDHALQLEDSRPLAVLAPRRRQAHLQQYDLLNS